MKLNLCICMASQDQNADGPDGDGGIPAGAADDVDGFRRLMATRISRSRVFLQDRMATFSMLLFLTFHQVLSTITKIAFRLRDDKEGMDETSGPKVKRRRRFRFKGAQHFQEGGSDNEEHKPSRYSLFDLCLKAHRVGDLLWRTLFLQDEDARRTVFAVPMAFWPQGEDRSSMFKRLTADILKTIANVLFRILYRFAPEHSAPHSFLQILNPDAPEEISLRRVREFLNSSECCLDQCWAVPVKKDVKEQTDDSAMLECLRDHLKSFKEQGRGVSLREEALHQWQRRSAGGNNAKATQFCRQAADMVLLCSEHNFEGCNNLSCAGAAAEMKDELAQVRKCKVVHKRPQDFGSPMIAFISKRSKEEPGVAKSEHIEKWKALSPEGKADFTRRHKLEVSRRRWAAQAAKEEADAQASDVVVKTPWNIGSAAFPLDASHVTKFLHEFSSRERGLAALERIQHATSNLYVSRIQDGSKYQSMDAAVVGAKAEMGRVIDTEAIQAGSWPQIGAEKMARSCFEKHPGLCATRDADTIEQIQQLWRSVPKKDTLLLIEQTSGRANQRIGVFARIITGLDWFRSFLNFSSCEIVVCHLACLFGVLFGAGLR